MQNQQQLRSLDALLGYGLGAQDGNIGSCKDFLFDDKDWTVRYVVADTRKWLPGRKVLLSPLSIGPIDVISRTMIIELTKEQIESAPPLDSDAPVSRQYEQFYNQYFQWDDYWAGTAIWGNYPSPRPHQREKKPPQEVKLVEEDKVNLRSTREVLGYRIRATDDSIGHIEDCIVDEQTWEIRYLVIDTSNWLPASKRVIISPQWVRSVDWAERTLEVKVTREQVENSPPYDQTVPVYRDYEQSIFDHYNFPYYW